MTHPTPPDKTAERKLAGKIEQIRRDLDLSYGELSRAMTDAGCPIDRSSLQKIERGTPRRKITVNELVAFAEVFNVPVSSLIDAPEELAVQLGWRDLINAESLANVMATASEEYWHHMRSLTKLRAENDEFRDLVRERYTKYRENALREARKQGAIDGYDMSTDQGLKDYLAEWSYESPVIATAKDVLGIRGRFGVDDGE